tara:strand:+ start:1443 stop:1772 length:330 start_codon:yes stop_codon:yes gene_type:complete
MQKDSGKNTGDNKKINMRQKISVTINSTEKKYICLDSKATEEYTYIKVGYSYKEAIFDTNGQKNQKPQHFILLLVFGVPFYVKKQYLSRFDEEGDDMRRVLCGSQIFLN